MRIEIKEFGLFKTGDFTLHSGGKSWFLIDSNALTDGDIEFLAEFIVKELKIDNFEVAVGIPRGGTRLAETLNDKYAGRGPMNHVLIIDDVCTTGDSLEEYKKELEDHGDTIIGGVVIFNRGNCPNWVTPIFQMTLGMRR